MEMNVLNVLLCCFSIALMSCGPVGSPNGEIATGQPIDLLQLLNERSIPDSELSISISKADYRLDVLCQGNVLKSYPVVFGGNPVDPKRMEGDQCTPEGTFKVRDHYPHKSWTHFIWFDYPNEQSVIDFENAKAQGQIGEEATIGGEVGIHGVPEGKDYLIDERVNWTLGCIALKEKDIEELSKVVQIGTSITID